MDINIINDISLLYELSLSSGQSINLEENCDKFIKTLMARKNLDFASVWIKNQYLPDKPDDGNVSLVYANPKFKIEKTSISIDHPVFSYLKNRDYFSFSYVNDAFSDIMFEKSISKGAFAVFALDDIGFIKLYSSLIDLLFSNIELNKLVNVIKKFTISIKGCIYHKKSVIESEKKVQAEKASIEIEKKYREIVESVNDIIYRADSKGYFTFVNPVALRITGYKEHELIGKHYLTLIAQNYQEKLREYYSSQAHNKTPTTYLEFPLIRKDGKEIWVGQNVQVAYNKDGDVTEFFAITRDITDRKKAEEALRQSEEKYRILVENAGEAISLIDYHGRLLILNNAAAQLFGGKPKDFEGKTLWDVLLKEFAEKRIKLIRKVIESGQSSFDESSVSFQGKLYWFQTNMQPIKDNTGKFTSALTINVDITERKQAELELDKLLKKLEKTNKELEVAKVEAESANTAKSRFLASMSHELRTPISAVYSIHELLQNTDLTEKQKRYLDIQKSSANNLLAIVNNILDFSKIEAGVLTLEESVFDIYKLIKKIIETFNYMALGKSIALDYSIDPKINCVLIGDSVRINQILINLVNNAIKFTNKGLVRLDCNLVSSTSQTNLIEFVITDTGIGIDQFNIDNIFESFKQEDNSTTRKFGGTGLGLAISKQLVELMNGEIKAESKKGTGSKFTVKINLKVGNADDLEHKQGKAEINEETLRGVKILLAEDNLFNQEIIQALIEKWNAVIDLAENGQVAVEKFKANNYDIVLMDKQMPVMGGIAATEIIRKELRSNVPIIAMTADVIRGVIDQCLNAGMNDYISKPFDSADLFEKIARLLNKEIKYIDSAPKQSSASESSAETKKLYDLSKLKEACLGDEQRTQKMAKRLLDELPDDLLKLTAHFNNGEYNETSKIAHRIKPNVDFLGVPRSKSNLQLIQDYASLPKLFNDLEKVIKVPDESKLGENPPSLSKLILGIQLLKEYSSKDSKVDKLSELINNLNKYMKAVFEELKKDLN